MSALEETIQSGTRSPLPSENVRRHARKSHRASLLRFAWWTVPLHLLMGFGVWWLIRNEPERLASLLVGVHVAFPALLLVTVRWWWSRWGELLALLLINHAVTFGVLFCLPWE